MTLTTCNIEGLDFVIDPECSDVNPAMIKDALSAYNNMKLDQLEGNIKIPTYEECEEADPKNGLHKFIISECPAGKDEEESFYKRLESAIKCSIRYFAQ